MGYIVLNIKRSEFSKVFNSEKLFKVQMLQPSDENGISLSEWCMEYLYGKGSRDLAHEFYDTKNIEHLEISDFDIKKESLEDIDTLLTEKEKTNLTELRTLDEKLMGLRHRLRMGERLDEI